MDPDADDGGEVGFRVDIFRKIPASITIIFLTHFHADHYDGIEDALTTRYDITVFCTEITRKLVLSKFRISHDQVQPLHMCEPRFITSPLISEAASFTVTALPANHCPGSAALLFEFSNGARWLHTGDFRYTKEMENMYEWKKAVSVDKLFLDTTFCNKRRFTDFPLKVDAQEQIVDLIQKRIADEKRVSGKPITVYLRCQSFGTEEVFLKIKERLGIKTQVPFDLYKTLVQIDSRFRDVISSECESERESECELDKKSSTIHVCNEFPQKRESRSLYIRVSAQWSQFSVCSDLTKPKLLDGVWNVLYSGHSSWNELRDFVSFVKPKNIVSLVKCDVSSFSLLKDLSSGEESLSPPPLKKKGVVKSSSDEQKRLYDDVMKLLDDYNSK